MADRNDKATDQERARMPGAILLDGGRNAADLPKLVPCCKCSNGASNLTLSIRLSLDAWVVRCDCGNEAWGFDTLESARAAWAEANNVQHGE